MPYTKAVLVVHEKFVFADEAIVEIKAWQVPVTVGYFEGFKYSMVYISPQRQRVLGYDNSKRQGHHRHRLDEQVPIEFQSIEELVSRFLDEVRTLRGGRQ